MKWSINQELAPAIRARLLLGQTSVQIAKEYGVSSSALSRFVIRFGLKPSVADLSGDALEWRTHPSLPDYVISENGKVRRVTGARTRHAGHCVKGHLHGHANATEQYWAYKLVTPNGKRQFWAHRLVAECFIGPQPTPKHEVAHWDGNPLNNHYRNLRWVTPLGNGADRARHGSLKGHFNGRAVLSVEQVREARGKYSGLHGQQSALAREYGLSRSAMRSLLNGEHWSHV